jgi:hypothetical protein
MPLIIQQVESGFVSLAPSPSRGKQPREKVAFSRIGIRFISKILWCRSVTRQLFHTNLGRYWSFLLKPEDLRDNPILRAKLEAIRAEEWLSPADSRRSRRTIIRACLLLSIGGQLFGKGNRMCHGACRSDVFHLSGQNEFNIGMVNSEQKSIRFIRRLLWRIYRTSD